MGQLEKDKLKYDIQETKNELVKVTTKTAEEQQRDLEDSIETLAAKADINKHIKDVKRLTKSFEVEDDMENKPKLAEKLEEAKKLVAAD